MDSNIFCFINFQMCTINAKNYGSAFWMSFLKISRLVLNHLQPKDVYYFCSSAQDIILQDNGYVVNFFFLLFSTLHIPYTFLKVIKNMHLLSYKQQLDVAIAKTMIDTGGTPVSEKILLHLPIVSVPVSTVLESSC